MIRWAKYRPVSGEIIGLGMGDDLPADTAEMHFVPLDAEHEDLDPREWQVSDGQLVRRPVPLPTTPMPSLYSFNQWVDRFPFAAQVAIVSATQTDPVAKLIYDRAMSAGASSAINPADPRTVEGVQYLVGAGYISQADADLALAP